MPFQLSANVTPVPELFSPPPTAVHALTELHETLYNALDFAPDGFGVVLIVHSVPFQLSANVTSTPELFV